MEFNSLDYAVFLTIVTTVYFILQYKYRWVLLLGASLFFGTSFGTANLIMITVLVTVSYYCAIKVEQMPDMKGKKLFLASGTCFILTFLFIFKYVSIYIPRLPGALDFGFSWFIPIGLSFYTMKMISYLFDVYQGKIPAEKHFGYFALYIAFFPTLMCGPIERAGYLISQLRGNYDFNYDRVTNALYRIAWGLFKKIVVADRLSLYVNTVYENVNQYQGWPLIIATFFYAIQLYCDFSGYTDIALGTANLFGYRLTENFVYPYFSRSIKEFWSRWHVSLSSWLKDYIYLPLGGSRVSKIRTYTNILAVFMVSGLWHGASLNFLIWGLTHGLLLIVQKASKPLSDFISTRVNTNKYVKAAHVKTSHVLQILMTFTAVNFTWIFFRSNSVSDALYIINNLFVNLSVINKENITLGVGNFKLMATSVLLFALAELLHFKGFLNGLSSRPVFVRWLAYYLFVMAIVIFGVFKNNNFLYGKF